MASDQQIVFSFLKFLKEHGNQEELEVVSQCLSEGFGVNIDNNDDKNKYEVPFDLKDIFKAGLEQLYNQDPEAKRKQEMEQKFNEFLDLLKQKGYFDGTEEGTPEYQSKYEKAREKFMSRTPSSEEAQKKEAEQLKNKGNEMMKQKNYESAIEYYTQAINTYDQNHVFYANRAAAHSYRKQYDNAIQDCRRAIEINPDYSKAYSRLGTAYFYKGQFREAIDEGYRKALDLDPSNTSYKADLETAEKKLNQSQSSSAGQQMPNPFAGAGGGAGGMEGIFQNPAFLNMAQQMMERPEMRDMVNNFASNMMGQNGGDMSQLFGNMAQGGAAGDASAPSSGAGEGEGQEQEQGNESSGAGGAGAGAGGMPGMPGMPNIDPSMLQSIRDDPEFKNNPKIQSIMEEMRNEGPLSLMKYLGDPDVMELVNKLTSRAFNNQGSGSSGDGGDTDDQPDGGNDPSGDN
eukprot:gb/GECH01012151.1/.p1 GENE.gb/GECH01012151.1/~~gb/GECH01012151.1/.p1  ORF type:complete len:458 (+),score=158.58 gb/GECH01012151.1/:1-1374(+)